MAASWRVAWLPTPVSEALGLEKNYLSRRFALALREQKVRLICRVERPLIMDRL